MQFQIKRDILLRSLSIAHNVIERKNTLPILSNVLLKIKDKKLNIIATDLDLVFYDEISDLKIEKEGSTTTSATVLYDLLRKLPTNIDICIIDVGWENQNACIMGAVPLLGENSIILTSEPEVPDENETDENKIAAFNEWIVLVKMLNETHEIGFVPMFGGTLIGIRKVNR